MKNQAAGTAYGPMVIVAMEQLFPEEKRMINDNFAFLFLPPALKAMVKFSRWSVIMDLLVKSSERHSPGVWAGILCRKRYIDLKLTEALKTGIAACINLGAGLDTRACRLPDLKTTHVFEVDLPGTINYKKHILQKLFGGIPGHVTLVPIDFDKEELNNVLTMYGCQSGQKSFIIWEGVTQDLTEEGVRKTFRFLEKAVTGSRLIFTYVRKDFIDGIECYGLDTLYRQFRVKSRLWRFGLAPEQVGAFLQQYGWKEVEQMSCRDLSILYKQPDNRLANAMEIERLVFAEKI